MINNEIYSIIDLAKHFNDESECISHLEKLRWNGNVVSPFDETSKVYVCKGNKYRCKNTGKYFNVKTNTLFDGSKVPLQKWFMAIYILTKKSTNINSVQLSKLLNINQKTSWYIIKRIKKCYNI